MKERKNKKEKVLGFWDGCPCEIGGTLFEVQFPFFFDEFLLTRAGAEKELTERKNYGYIKVYDNCSNCGGNSCYVLFKEKDLDLVLKSFPFLTQLRTNYDFFRKRGYYDED